jgi:hypothetical protein
MEIRIDSKVKNTRPAPPFGININYLRDSDANRIGARPLRETVKAAGMRFLRYPGGGKSDAVLHMTKPFTECKPQPRTKEYIKYSEQAQMMDFDEFISVCRYAGCEPHVVVGCDTFERKETTMEEYLDNAVNWVLYSNIVKKYGVKYWEIGNENWNAKNIPPAEFGRIVSGFSRAMKQIDPTILIGASGKGMDWWEEFLPEAVGDIDFLSVSVYPCWDFKRYDFYADNDDYGLVGEAKTAVKAVRQFAPDHMDRLFVVVSEFNSRDYALEFENEGWGSENNLGHALANMDMCGQIALEEKIRYAMIWNTRWMRQSNQHRDIFYGLDANNGLMPSTMCLYIWGRFMRNEVLSVECPKGLAGFAYKDADGLTAMIINKKGAEAEVSVDVPAAQAARTYIYSGTDPSDQYPIFRQYADYTAGDKRVLPPYSLTVFDWRFV